MSRALKIGLVKKGNAGWMGGQEYIKNIALAAKAAAAASGRAIDVCMLVPEGDETGAVAAFARPVFVPSDMPPMRLGRLRAWFSGSEGDRPFDYVVRKEKLDFVYPVDALAATVPSRRAAWVPDLQHRLMPGYCTPQELVDREDWIASMMASANTLVFSSLASLEDFRAAYGGDAHSMEVLRFRVSLPEGLCSESAQAVADRYSLPRGYFLVSNQFWQHKNHLVLVEAMALARMRVPDLVVAMTGATVDYRNPGYPDRVFKRIDELGLSGNARVLGLIPKVDQLQLLRACRAVIQPSLFEGWNTVVEEARCLGKEIILSDLPVHREQGPPKVQYFDPSDAEALANCIVQHALVAEADNDESRAVEDYRALFLQFGRRFLEIVRDAGGAGRG